MYIYANVWADHQIQPGDHFESQITSKLDDCDLVLLLLSSDFVNSRFCWSIEFDRALRRSDQGQTRIIPINVRPVYLPSDNPLSTISAFPRLPIAEGSLDAGMVEVAKAIETIALAMISKSNSSRESVARSLTEEDLSNFQNRIKDRLTSVLDDLDKGRESFLHVAMAIDSIHEALLKRKASRITVVLLGRIKAGKSTLANGIIGSIVSPSDPDRATLFPVRTSANKEYSLTVYHRDSRRKDIYAVNCFDWFSVQSSVTLDGVREVHVKGPQFLSWAPEVVDLVDTPGVGSSVDADTVISYRESERNNVAIVVYRHEDAPTKELAALREKLAAGSAALIAVCNLDERYYGEQRRNPDALAASIDRAEREFMSRGFRCLRLDCLSILESRVSQTLKGESALPRFDPLETELSQIISERESLLSRTFLSEIQSHLREVVMHLHEERLNLRPHEERVARRLSELERDRTGILAACDETIKALDEWIFSQSGKPLLAGAGVGGFFGFMAWLPMFGPLAPFLAVPAVLGAALVAAGSMGEKKKAQKQWSDGLDSVRKSDLVDVQTVDALGSINDVVANPEKALDRFKEMRIGVDLNYDRIATRLKLTSEYARFHQAEGLIQIIEQHDVALNTIDASRD